MCERGGGMDAEVPARKWLALAAEREALRRMEDAARTEEEYRKVIDQAGQEKGHP